MFTFVLVMIFFAVGIALQHTVKPDRKWIFRINAFVIHCAFPALILRVVPNIEIDSSILIPALSYWLCIPVAGILSYSVCRWQQWNRQIFCVIFVMCICGNTAFMGIPITKALLGSNSVVFAIIYDQMGSFLALSTVVIIAISLLGESKQSFSWKTLCIKLITFTPLTTLIVALTLPIAQLLAPAQWLLQGVSILIVPTTMIAIGLQFSFKLHQQYRHPLLCILGIKMLFIPLLTFAALSLTTLPEVMTNAIVLQAAAAPMLTAAMLLLNARIASELVASTLAAGTLLSFITLPLWAWALQL